MSDVDVRASDDERQAVIDRLAGHFRSGRLEADELEERTARATAARTRSELTALEADLPPDNTAAAAAPAEWVRHRRERVVSALALVAFLWVIWAATDFGGFAWPIFPTAFIGLGIVRVLWGGADPGELPAGRHRRRHHHGRHRRPLPPPPPPRD